MPKYTCELLERAKELRKNMTPQEQKLWEYVKNFKLKFYRQRPIGSYIVDFYCRKLRLVIEIDGSQHNTPQAREYDKIRTEYMNSLGLEVLRFTNYDIDNNFTRVCEEINRFASEHENAVSPPLIRGDLGGSTTRPDLGGSTTHPDLGWYTYGI